MKTQRGADTEKIFFSFGAGDRLWLLTARYYLLNYVVAMKKSRKIVYQFLA